MNPTHTSSYSRPTQRKNPYVKANSESWKKLRVLVVKVILAMALVILTMYSFVSCAAAPGSGEERETRKFLLYTSPSGEKIYKLDLGYPVYFSENIHGEITNVAAH